MRPRRFLSPPSAIRTGMSAEVRIFVEQLADALQHGVYEYREHHFCLVVGRWLGDWRSRLGPTTRKW